MKDEKGEREEKEKKGKRRQRGGGQERGSGWAQKQYISASAVSEAGSC